MDYKKSRAIKEVDQSADNKDTSSFSPGDEIDFIRKLQEEHQNESSRPKNEAGPPPSPTPHKKKKKKKKKDQKLRIRTKRSKVITQFFQYYIACLIIFGGLFFSSFYIKNFYINIAIYAIVLINTPLYFHTMSRTKFKNKTKLPLDILSKIAEGNLAIDLENTKGLKEELERFYEPLSAIINKMSEMVSKVELSALDLAGNSDALTYFATSMANKADEQFNSINIIDESAKNLNDSMQEVKDNVQKAYQISVESIKEADSSSIEILSLIEEMNRINEMSDKIVTTMNFIDDIADETNLLALNAAIQAAHAGEEGKGFGVVASEIKLLAQSSSEATKTIYQIVENTIESILKGVKASQKAKRELMKIISSIKSTENLMSEINESINQQSQTTTQLKESLANINDLTKNINDDTQNMKSAISNLSGQAQVLTKLISFFELKSAPIRSDSIIGIDVNG